MSKKRPDDFSLPYGDQGQSDEDHSYLAQSPTLVPDASNWTGSGNADARGAGGGPGGGGKPGGGGSGVVTTYTSGNPTSTTPASSISRSTSVEDGPPTSRQSSS